MRKPGGARTSSVIVMTNARLASAFCAAASSGKESQATASALAPSQSMNTPINKHVDAPNKIGQEAGFLNVTEVARKLRVGKTALYGWLARGHIAHHRVGRLIRIKASDVEAFLSRNRVEQLAPHTYDRYPQT